MQNAGALLLAFGQAVSAAESALKTDKLALEMFMKRHHEDLAPILPGYREVLTKSDIDASTASAPFPGPLGRKVHTIKTKVTLAEQLLKKATQDYYGFIAQQQFSGQAAVNTQTLNQASSSPVNVNVSIPPLINPNINAFMTHGPPLSSSSSSSVGSAPNSVLDSASSDQTSQVKKRRGRPPKNKQPPSSPPVPLHISAQPPQNGGEGKGVESKKRTREEPKGATQLSEKKAKKQKEGKKQNEPSVDEDGDKKRERDPNVTPEELEGIFNSFFKFAYKNDAANACKNQKELGLRLSKECALDKTNPQNREPEKLLRIVTAYKKKFKEASQYVKDKLAEMKLVMPKEPSSGAGSDPFGESDYLRQVEEYKTQKAAFVREKMGNLAGIYEKIEEKFPKMGDIFNVQGFLDDADDAPGPVSNTPSKNAKENIMAKALERSTEKMAESQVASNTAMSEALKELGSSMANGLIAAARMDVQIQEKEAQRRDRAEQRKEKAEEEQLYSKKENVPEAVKGFTATTLVDEWLQTFQLDEKVRKALVDMFADPLLGISNLADLSMLPDIWGRDWISKLKEIEAWKQVPLAKQARLLDSLKRISKSPLFKF